MGLLLAALASCVGVRGGEARFELEDSHLYAQVRIDGRGPYWFLIDTGSEPTVISADDVHCLAGELGSLGDGLLGVDFLRAYRVTLDYPRAHVTLEP